MKYKIVVLISIIEDIENGTTFEMIKERIKYFKIKKKLKLKAFINEKKENIQF